MSYELRASLWAIGAFLLSGTVVACLGFLMVSWDDAKRQMEPVLLRYVLGVALLIGAFSATMVLANNWPGPRACLR